MFESMFYVNGCSFRTAVRYRALKKNIPYKFLISTGMAIMLEIKCEFIFIFIFFKYFKNN